MSNKGGLSRRDRLEIQCAAMEKTLLEIIALLPPAEVQDESPVEGVKRLVAELEKLRK